MLKIRYTCRVDLFEGHVLVKTAADLLQRRAVRRREDVYEGAGAVRAGGEPVHVASGVWVQGPGSGLRRELLVQHLLRQQP